MTIAELRIDLGLTYEALAKALGLVSKGQAHGIETGRVKCSPRVALAVERLSEGRIQAGELNEDVALIRSAGEAA